jgi:hypothetical protein
VVDVNPTEIVIKVSDDDQRVVRVNRDDVTAYTGEDDQRRTPVTPRLVVTRCCNVIMRCNGVKQLGVERREPKGCALRNEHCECYTGDFFSMNPTTQVTLLNGVQIGEFPKKTRDD